MKAPQEGIEFTTTDLHGLSILSYRRPGRKKQKHCNENQGLRVLLSAESRLQALYLLRLPLDLLFAKMPLSKGMF